MPNETGRAAELAFGKKNSYSRVGLGAANILTGAEFDALYWVEEMPQESTARLCLVTIFQLLEGLTDHQAAEAIRVRRDWQYALHLPLNYPGLIESLLCDFRRRLLNNPTVREKFDVVLRRVANEYWFDRRLGDRDLHYALESVCTRNRLVSVEQAMNKAVQALVVRQQEWLREIVRPHWYQRYARGLTTLHVPDATADQVAFGNSIGADALYLLKSIAETKPDLMSLEEVQALNRIIDTQYERQQNECKWRASGCPGCPYRTGAGTA